MWELWLHEPVLSCRGNTVLVVDTTCTGEVTLCECWGGIREGRGVGVAGPLKRLRCVVFKGKKCISEA